MDRYMIVPFIDQCGEPDYATIPYAPDQTNGEWVKYSDVAKLQTRVRELEDCLVLIYTSGYKAGHNDTVESCYTDVHRQDVSTYFSETVNELIQALKGGE